MPKNETDIIRPDLHAFLSDGSLFMNNANGDYYTYDADFIYKDRFRIHYNRRSDFTKVLGGIISFSLFVYRYGRRVLSCLRT